MNVLSLQLHNIHLALKIFFGGLVIIVVSIPLILNKIPPNPFFGIRLTGLNKNEENWYKVNRYGGIILLRWSTPLLIFAILLLFLPHIRYSENFNLAIIIVFSLPLIIAFIQIILYWQRNTDN